MIRPYTDEEMTSVHLCAVRDIGGGPAYTIIGWTSREVQLSDGGWYSFSYLLDNYTFVDGSPCGIDEEKREYINDVSPKDSVSFNELIDVISELAKQYPYKEESRYSEGWNDALDILQTTIENL